ncbi:hypothetical protein K435DRAFT_856282 [Dendrothele bispora CBS 962.96]|uniref:Uncharacterized protein n=1 Tax=Dendrothele bispora (strain CBS 962.96) TaxID=1314807 RepID=A0A4S8MA10_DENBC|nr:hypothetical protein K435DRAFT_856282 [Dendrothele bispora CBS 962.96]
MAPFPNPLTGIIVATILWFIISAFTLLDALTSNKLLLVPPLHSTPADSAVERAYVFDVHYEAGVYEGLVLTQLELAAGGCVETIALIVIVPDTVPQYQESPLEVALLLSNLLVSHLVLVAPDSLTHHLHRQLATNHHDPILTVPQQIDDNGTVIFDRFFDGVKDWDPCDLQPCPNRYHPYPPVIQPEDRSWAVLVNQSQEDFIRGDLQRIAQPVPQQLTFPPSGLSASGSEPPEPPEQPAQPPADPPAGSSSQEDPSTSVVNPPKEPTPPPAQPSTHPSRNPSRRPTPTPSPPPSPPPATDDLDSDDETMSKATKAFDKVTKLKADGSNWGTWATRVEHAATSIGYSDYLDAVPADSKKQEDADLLNAMIGRLPDSIFRRY